VTPQSSGKFKVGDQVLSSKNKGVVYEVVEVLGNGKLGVKAEGLNYIYTSEPEIFTHVSHKAEVGDVLEFTKNDDGLLKGVVYRDRNGKFVISTGVDGDICDVCIAQNIVKIGYVDNMDGIDNFNDADVIVDEYFSGLKPGDVVSSCGSKGNLRWGIVFLPNNYIGKIGVSHVDTRDWNLVGDLHNVTKIGRCETIPIEPVLPSSIDERVKAYFSTFESYKLCQATWVKKNDIEEGSKIKVTRTAEWGEQGWDTGWCNDMNEMVGKTCIVEDVDDDDICLKCDGKAYCFPYFVLERVS
jgi:hypothetical protein